MKPIVILFLLISIVCVFILVIKPPAKITIHVVTDKGIPISNIPVGLSTFDYWQPGELFGTDIYKNYEGKTDSKGIVTFTILSERGDVAFGTGSGLIGYYPHGGNYKFKNIYGGVNWLPWRPWNPTVELILKPIKNPIPMYAQAVRYTLPVKNSAVGFDLEVGDWVVPYGKGITSDFIFTLNEKVPFVSATQPYDVTNTLSFSNKSDGIQSVLVSQNQGTFFRMLGDAPQGGYNAILAQELSLSDNKRLSGAVSEDQNYFFRVRTVLDGQNKVKSALYGKIRGPIECGPQGIVQFTYYLNPTTNDRNMESDPTKNLFQNLTDDQQVKAP